jgi:hypothetical protein
MGPTGSFQVNAPGAGLILGYQSGITTPGMFRVDTVTTSLVVGGPTGPNVGLYVGGSALTFNGSPVGGGGIQGVTGANNSIAIGGTGTAPTVKINTLVGPPSLTSLTCDFATHTSLGTAQTIDSTPFGTVNISALTQGFYLVEIKLEIGIATDGSQPILNTVVSPGTTITHVLETVGATVLQNYLQSYFPVPDGANAIPNTVNLSIAPLILTSIIYIPTGTTGLTLKAYAVPAGGASNVGNWNYKTISVLGGTTDPNNIIVPIGP